MRSGLISSQRELFIVIHKVLMSTIIWTLLACVVCLSVETVCDESEQLCECVAAGCALLAQSGDKVFVGLFFFFADYFEFEHLKYLAVIQPAQVLGKKIPKVKTSFHECRMRRTFK